MKEKKWTQLSDSENMIVKIFELRWLYDIF